MTDPSLQKMQTTPPESNMQKMHIPAEWVEAACEAANGKFYNEEIVRAALTAVIPLIREDERERLAKLAEETDTHFAAWTVRDWKPDADGKRLSPINLRLSDWLRAQGRE